MVKHIQTIRRQIVDELFECVWPFYEIGAERVKHESSYCKNPCPWKYLIKYGNAKVIVIQLFLSYSSKIPVAQKDFFS